MKRFFRFFSILLCLCLCQSMSMQAATPTKVVGPTNGYGFLAGPNGEEWAYTIATTSKFGYLTSVVVEVFNEQSELVGKIVDSLRVDDPNVTGVRDLQVTSFVTKKFFNFDNNYELMLFITANTKQYVNKYFSRVYSIASDMISQTPVCEMPGYMVASKNLGEYTENYTTIFKRDSMDIHYFDVYTKASYASPKSPELKHTFQAPYANMAAMNDLIPIFMVKNGAVVNYFTQQYEQPFFVPGTPLDQDPIVNENNNLIITQYDNKFKVVGETKIAMTKDADPAYLYTFYSLGALTGEQDIILDYNGTGKPAFVITEDNYEIASDGSVFSFRLFDHAGQLINTIAEHTLGTIHLTDIPGHERQYGFMKVENEIELVQFVDVPSCQTKARVALSNNGATFSGNWARVAKGDSYQYVVSLLQGDNQDDGTVTQRIAWLTNKGKVDRYDIINLGKNVEAANVWIASPVLNPHLFNNDDAYEYAALIKRSGVDGNILVVANTQGEQLLEVGADPALGGSLNMVDIVSMHTNHPQLLCVHTDGDTFTLNYFALPLTQSTIKGQGTEQDPYQIYNSSDFLYMEQAPDAHYVLMNDIDFMNVPFAGISVPFTGVLDGATHTINNLTLNGNGLFHAINDEALIYDLKILQPIIQLGETVHAVGLVANSMQGNMSGDDGSMDLETVSATLRNVHIEGAKAVGDNYKGFFGGLVGEAALFVNIIKCSMTDADITLPLAEGIGGIAGTLATSSQVKASLFTGTITGGDAVAGIAAKTNDGERITHCHVDATLMGTNTIGGVVAYSQRAPIYNCLVEGKLQLQAEALVGKVGGIVGELELDETGKGPIVIANCLVGIESITLPIDSVYAHRVVGFSGADKYNYFEQIYEDPEKKITNCYVISDLAVIDATIEQNDTTTEGATLAFSELTTDWLTNHGFVQGTTVDAPWMLGEQLTLWYEVDGVFSGIKDIVGTTINGNTKVRKIMLNGRILIIVGDQIYDMTGTRIQ